MRPVAAAEDRVGDAGLLGARDEVVDQHAVAPLRARGLLVERRLEQVEALQVLHHDTLDAQVVAPHLLDEFGVVAALDEDPARAGDPGARIGDGERPGCRAGGGCGCDSRGCHQDDVLAVDEEARAEREHPLATVAVFDLDGARARPR